MAFFPITCKTQAGRITGSPSSKYELQRTSALSCNIRNIRICMGKKTYRFCYLGKRKDFNKRQLTLLKMCVTSLPCGPRADSWPFYGFLCQRFSLYIKVYQGWALQRSGPTEPISIPEKDNNGSKRLCPTPSVTEFESHAVSLSFNGNASPSQGSVDGFRRERLQRFVTFDSLSVQRRLEAR